MNIQPSPELFNYGIQTEQSDIRAHVGVKARKVFIFETKNGLKAITNHPEIEPRTATQPGAVGATAKGVPVPLEFIEDLRTVSIKSWPVWDGWTKELSTTEKGKRAVGVVVHLLKKGGFPLWFNAEEDERTNVQLKGTDIVLFAKKKIQVKCDFDAGPKFEVDIKTGGKIPTGCTGNIYLQTAERNPLKQH